MMNIATATTPAITARPFRPMMSASTPASFGIRFVSGRAAIRSFSSHT